MSYVVSIPNNEKSVFYVRFLFIDFFKKRNIILPFCVDAVGLTCLFTGRADPLWAHDIQKVIIAVVRFSSNLSYCDKRAAFTLMRRKGVN